MRTCGRAGVGFLSPLCSADNLAVCTRSLEICDKITQADTKQLQQEFPNADLSKVSKISYHFTLNGLKCRADRVGQYLSQFLGKTGFDFSAYVKLNGGPRV